MNSMLIANAIEDVVTGARVMPADADSADGKNDAEASGRS